MKKFFVLLAAVAMIANVACTKVNPEEKKSEKISFSVANYAPQTKLTALQDETFTSFKTTAKLFAAGLAPQDYMTNVAVNFTAGTPNVWAPARDYYWPKEGYINFYSFVSSKTELEPTLTFDGAKTTATAAYTADAIGANDNILLADAALNQTQNLQKYIETSKVASGVPTLFRHLLAKVSFDVKLATTADKKTTSTKFKVTILNSGDNLSTLTVVKNGALTLTNVYAADAEAKAWTVADDATVWTAPETASIETIDMLTPSLTLAPADDNSLETAAADLLALRTVLPQTLGDDVVFTIAYKIETYYGNEQDPYMTEIITASKKLTEFTSAITAWNINTKNTYHIIIDPVGNTIKFDPAVEEWTVVDGGTLSLPESN